MATTRQLHLHRSQSLNPNPRVLHLLRPRSSRGNSGEGSTSSCSPVLDTAWDWGMCGGSRTFVIEMEEVSSLQACSLPSEVSDALHAWVCVYVCKDLLHPFGQEPFFALPLGVRLPPNHAGLFCTLCPELSKAAFLNWELEHKAFLNPLNRDRVFPDYIPDQT